MLLRTIHLFSLLTYLLPTTMASAKTLFIGTYGGAILTAEFTAPSNASYESAPSLAITSATNGSAPAPSWQELAHNGSVLYTVEETTALDPSKGAVTSYSVDRATGVLTKIKTAVGQLCPVSLAVAPDEKTLWTANYDGHGVSVYGTTPDGNVEHVRDFTFTLSGPGTVPDRQDSAHPHQALFDPTGAFVLVPDLGADLIRVFSAASQEALEPIPVTAGTGPRHGVFHTTRSNDTVFYLIGELSNTITVFSVSYNAAGAIQMHEKQATSTLPANYTSPTDPEPLTTPSAAEIAVHPSGKWLWASNRFDKVYAADGTSDAVSNYAIGEDGTLQAMGSWGSGVEIARHIVLSPDGEWLVVEGQGSDEVRVFRVVEGTVDTGAVTTLEVPGGAVCVQWAE